MKRLSNIENNGFPVTGATLMQIDEIIGQVADFSAKINGDNYIASGVKSLGGGNYSDGYIVWDGEILPFQGGAFQEQITIVENNVTATYQDNLEKGYYKNRYARFGNTGVTTFDFSDLKPVYTSFANQFLNAVLLPYTGLLSKIPKGFAIADGTDGKPNAGGRVFQAIGTGEGQDEIGTVGGNDYLTLIEENIPKHQHESGHEALYSYHGGGDYVGKRSWGGPEELDTYAKSHSSPYGGDDEGKTAAFDNRMAFIKGAYITWVGF